ncbi:mcfG, partial [Symbiodinium microadriaticum]
VDEWWTVAGHVLVQRYLEWATQTFPDRFQERILHTSLTIEESMRAVTPAIHLHAQFTFAKRVDRTQLVEKYLFDVTVCVELVICYLCFYKVPHSRNLSCFKFGSIKPHIECNHARGKDVFPSRARAHFYVYASKVGSLWNYTNFWPFIDYEVNPAWITSWWSVQKLSHRTYQRYLLQCRRSYKNFLQNAEAAKTSFAKSLFKCPLVLTVQGATTLNLREFKYGQHDGLILDNLNDFQFILDYRAILQANNDTHRLGDSSTGMYAYQVYLWATPIVLTLASW